MTKDTFDLERFVEAQDRTYNTICHELDQGRKESYWIWFVFPQLKGLGFSANSSHFGISGLAEAQAFLEHPVLGARLQLFLSKVMAHENRGAIEIFGQLDALKFQSSLTLFVEAAVSEVDRQRFLTALQTFFQGEKDKKTLERLKR